MKIKFLIIAIPLFLAACTGRYAGLQNTMASCGYPSAPMPKLHTCMTSKVTITRKAGEQDYYNKSGANTLAAIDELQTAVRKKKMTNKQANARLQNYMQEQIETEKRQAQQAAVAIAVIAGVALVANCAHNGGCGGGGGLIDNNNRYHGRCQYPSDIAADGSRCGNRAASVRPGGWEPYRSPYYSRPSSYSTTSVFAPVTVASSSPSSGRCDYPWQTAKDGSKCGNRAASVRPNKTHAFGE